MQYLFYFFKIRCTANVQLFGKGACLIAVRKGRTVAESKHRLPMYTRLDASSRRQVTIRFVVTRYLSRSYIAFVFWLHWTLETIRFAFLKLYMLTKLYNSALIYKLIA